MSKKAKYRGIYMPAKLDLLRIKEPDITESLKCLWPTGKIDHVVSEL